MLKFTKMHGLGNDFVILDLRGAKVMPDTETLAFLSNRKLGVGCDQVITMQDMDDADCYMRIFNAPNADEAEACGNATRCVARMIMDQNGQGSCTIKTVAGLLECSADGEQITVDMGAPKLDWQDIPLSKEHDTLKLPLDGEPVGVNVGNPHCVYFIDEDVAEYPVTTIGPKIETDPLFPQKTNVEFVNVISRSRLKMRVWERNTGETQACGSGACAVAIAAIRRDLADREITVSLLGGDLHFHWRESDNHILMTGPATYVFEGTLHEA